MRGKLIGLLKDDTGQGMVEYGLIIALISIAAIAALNLMAPQISAVFGKATTALTGAAAP